MTTGETATPEPESDSPAGESSGGELERCRTELQAVSRELDSFIYSVAHDLRAPLRSIIGFNQAIAEDCAGSLDATVQSYVERVQENASRLDEMLDGLLFLSRVARSELQRHPVDLSELVRETASQLLAQEPQRSVEFLIPLGLQVEGDVTLLRQAIEHLVGNAWKFTAHRSQARIELGTVEDGDPHRLLYYMRDNGAGFEDRHTGRLFEPFQRLHTPSEFAGTGIGLALVRRIIQRHDGEVWIEGAVEQGATVYFRL